jgi:phosphopantetheinyl transferase
MTEDLNIPIQNWALSGEPFQLVAVSIDAADWSQVLTPEAHARTHPYTDATARARAGAAQWLKACWLPRQLGVDVVEWEIGEHGKPHLTGSAAGWGFNLSHTGDQAVAVLAKGSEIGVDLESTARKANIEGLAVRLFSESEQAQVREGGRAAFFTLWSQKEALMKALGCGWADGQIQRRTQLQQTAFQKEPATGATIWSRRILDGSYALAIAIL